MQKPSTCARPPWPQLLGCALAVTLTACGGGGGGGADTRSVTPAVAAPAVPADGVRREPKGGKLPDRKSVV